MALGLVSVKRPESVGSAIKVARHALFCLRTTYTWDERQPVFINIVFVVY